MKFIRIPSARFELIKYSENRNRVTIKDDWRWTLCSSSFIPSIRIHERVLFPRAFEQIKCSIRFVGKIELQCLNVARRVSYTNSKVYIPLSQNSSHFITVRLSLYFSIPPIFFSVSVLHYSKTTKLVFHIVYPKRYKQMKTNETNERLQRNRTTSISIDWSFHSQSPK